MLSKVLNTLDHRLEFPRAAAHCDIPCKIYDPMTAQLAALTVVRMLDLIRELTDAHPQLGAADQAQFIRLVDEKERHAKAVKEEVRVIWGDYFKAPQFEQVAGVHDMVHGIMLQASKCKQGIDRDAGLELVTQVNRFAAAFWQTKGIETFTAVCPYPPSLELVYPRLG
jgi:nickel superoxide dismutase